MNRAALVYALTELDAQLVARGFPAMSPWWKFTLARFLRSGRRRIVLRVGRRGGKSSTLCRLVVLLAIAGNWTIPPGDTGTIAFVSVSKDEASARLTTIAAILSALGIASRRNGDAIDLADRPLRFKVFAANVAAVSGFTSICFVCDELSKWRDADSGANPATEVLASLRPTTATQPGAIEILCSSPFGLDDAHAKAFDDGETEDQCVAEAPTWLANPSISEADTHKLERDERVWRREYAAIPQAGAMGAFDDDAVERAVRTPPTGARQCQRVTVIDASSGRKDSWTFARCGWDVAAGGARVLVFDSIDGFDGSFWK